MLLTGTKLLADAISPPVELHRLLTGWQTGVFSLLSLALAVVLGVWYVVSVARLAARGRNWSPVRTVSFLSGLALVVVALDSGLAAYGTQVFWVYVIQHMMLMNLVPILLAVAAPVTLALQASSRPTQRLLLAVLHNPVIEFLTNPLFVAVAVYATMLVYFLSPFYNFTLEHPWLHDLAYVHFLVSGYLFWWLVVGRDPSRARRSPIRPSSDSWPSGSRSTPSSGCRSPEPPPPSHRTFTLSATPTWADRSCGWWVS